MTPLSKEQISQIYSLIQKYHAKYLRPHGVVLPNLTRGTSYTKDALVLVYLAAEYPNTKVVSKAELTEFIQLFYPNVLDVQQARHLGAQSGWYILSGSRNDNASFTLNPGEYQLKTLEEPYPGFIASRRESVDSDYWEKLKIRYGFRCACCGSKEGEPHRYWRNTTTILEKGHKDPNQPLEPGNIIPQCKKCNRPDRNYWVYDDRGRVVQVANAKVIDTCSDVVKKEIYTRLYQEFNGKSPDEL